MSEIIGVTTQHFTPHNLQYLKRMRARFLELKTASTIKQFLSLKYLVSQHSTPLHATLNSENKFIVYIAEKLISHSKNLKSRIHVFTNFTVTSLVRKIITTKLLAMRRTQNKQAAPAHALCVKCNKSSQATCVGTTHTALKRTFQKFWPWQAFFFNSESC